MSMFVHSASAYQQLQSWRDGQTNANNAVMGPNGADADFSASFTNAATNYYSSAGTVAATQALNRLQQKAAAHAAKKSGPPPKGDQKLAAAQTAGKAMLASLGLDYGTMFGAPTTASKKSASGPYKAPTNASTGYAYVASSAANLSTLGAVNLLA